MAQQGGGTKAEKREAARKASAERWAAEARKRKRNKIIAIGSVVVGAGAVVALVVALVLGNVRGPVLYPNNMADGGIMLAPGLEPVLVDTGDGESAPASHEAVEGVDRIITYVDYMCPGCGQFESVYGEYLGTIVEQGAASIEIRPLSFLDRTSAGTGYSTRAAAAAACVIDIAPDSFYDFHLAMFANQPQEQTRGLSNDEIIEIANNAGADIGSCLNGKKFDSWVGASTVEAATGPVVGSTEPMGISITPSVFVNGVFWDSSQGQSFDEFYQSQSVHTAGTTDPATEEGADTEGTDTEGTAPEGTDSEGAGEETTQE
ncbi:DsbA family protein [Humidisolicoccus flavus]|uniref:DsbA family protein n=1 Tax=Humidisolicoccus flavus TaxID=3111414 RepID=UPI003254ADE7